MKKEMNHKLFLQLQMALDTVDSLIAIKDTQGYYTYVNKTVDEYYKEQFDSIVGKHYKEVYPLSEQGVVEKLDQEAYVLGKSINKTIHVYTDQGYIYVDSTRSPIYDEDHHLIGIISAGRNVTEREETKIKLDKTIKELEVLKDQYYQLAYIDELTKIGNRRKFYKEFLELKSKTEHVLIIIDLNNFKQINDTLGHNKGDEVLYEFAQALKKICDSHDGDAFRLGGDEFTLILPVSSPDFESFIDDLDQQLQGYHKSVTVSYGQVPIALNQDIDNLYRDFCVNRADDILYKYKIEKKKKLSKLEK